MEGTDHSRAVPSVSPREGSHVGSGLRVPLLSVLHVCPSTSGKLLPGHLAAVQRDDRVCILPPHHPRIPWDSLRRRPRILAQWPSHLPSVQLFVLPPLTKRVRADLFSPFFLHVVTRPGLSTVASGPASLPLRTYVLCTRHTNILLSC